jgi:hypothetical protein
VYLWVPNVSDSNPIIGSNNSGITISPWRARSIAPLVTADHLSYSDQFCVAIARNRWDLGKWTYAFTGWMTFTSSPKCSSICFRRYSLLPNPPTRRMADAVKFASSRRSIWPTISWKIILITASKTFLSSVEVIIRHPSSTPSVLLSFMLVGTMWRSAAGIYYCHKIGREQSQRIKEVEETK